MIKHLLSIDQLSREDVIRILDTAESFREVGTRVIKKVPALRGRTVVNLFYENSTRTRISFELAAKRLSADVINFSTSGSSVAKGESLKDTALTLQAMGADAIVIRHSSSGAPYTLSRWVTASVLNAGDGTHEHPTQALLDLFTIREHFPSFEGLRIAIVGDVRHSRVARSLTFAMSKMGGEVTLVGPPTLIPPEAQAWGGRLTNDLDEVLPKLDVCYMLRVQRERHPRIQRIVRIEFVEAPARQTRLHRASPGTDEPRRGDHLGSGGFASKRNFGSGDQRHRGADVAPLPDARRRRQAERVGRTRRGTRARGRPWLAGRCSAA